MEGGSMIDNGYRLYTGLDGNLHLDQIVAGRIYPLRPEASDAKLPQGFYTPDFTYLGDNGKGRTIDAAPVADTADIDYPASDDIDWRDDWREQPRVPKGTSKGGEFGKGGGGASKTPASDLMKDSPKLSEEQQKAKAAEIAEKLGATEKVEAARQRIEAGTATDKLHSNSKGVYTRERANLHRRILRKMFSREAITRATPAPGEKKTMTLLGGRGGSGKSWITKDGPVDTSNAILIDADHFKSQLPEYKGWNAGHTHEESDHLVSKAEKKAIRLGLNTVHDQTLKSSGSARKRMDNYEKKGYQINGHYMHLPPEMATERAIKRFLNPKKEDLEAMGEGGEGRFVPPEVVMANANNEENFDELIPRFNEWTVHDNRGSAPKFVAGSDHFDREGKRKTPRR
jgi:predicted ABC-type ATPase